MGEIANIFANKLHSMNHYKLCRFRGSEEDLDRVQIRIDEDGGSETPKDNDGEVTRAI